MTKRNGSKPQLPTPPPLILTTGQPFPAGAVREPRPPSHDSPDDDEWEQFVESMRRRGEAAKGLQDDLLTEVPLLYGSAGNMAPDGDPGIVLAKIHRDELVRRNGGIAAIPSNRDAPAELPFERAMLWLAVLLFAGLFFASYT